MVSVSELLDSASVLKVLVSVSMFLVLGLKTRTEVRPYFEHIFCILAISAPVERMFSQSGLIMRPNRSTMTDSLHESLIF